MDDPLPANIEGQKRVVHKVEHEIQWGYIAVGVGLLAVVWLGYRVIGPDDDLPKNESDSLRTEEV